MSQLYSVSTATRKTYIWAVPVLVIVFTFGGQILALLPAKYLNLITKENFETYPHILYLIIGSFTVVALIFALWIKLFEKENFASVGLVTSANPVKNYLFGMLTASLMAGVIVLAITLLKGYVEENAVNLELIDLIPVFILLLAFIIQAGTEEFVFRGWMMSRIAGRYGITAGIVGNSAIFALMHFDSDGFQTVSIGYTLMLTASAFAFAVFLSLLAIKEKSIWGACAWHTVWNWSFITWFGLPTTGLDLGIVPLVTDLTPVDGVSIWLTGAEHGPEGSILTLGVLLVASIWLIYKLKKSRS